MLFIILGVILVAVSAYFLITSYKKNTKDAQGTLTEISGKYSPDQNRFATRKEKKAADARAATLASLNVEAGQVRVFEEQQYQVNAVQDNRRIQEEQRDAVHETQLKAEEFFQYALDGNIKLIDSAVAKDMDLATYMKVREKQALDEAQIQQEERKALAEIRLAILAKKLDGHIEIGHLQKQLDDLYTEVYRLTTGNEPEEVKKRKIKSREKTIKTLEKDKTGREKKLLQEYKQQNPRRMGQKTDDGGDIRISLETDE